MEAAGGKANLPCAEFAVYREAALYILSLVHPPTVPMTSPTSGLDLTKSSEKKPSEMLTAPEPEQISKRQGQTRRALFSQNPRIFTSPHTHQASSTYLPFPLNLPPSYPVYRGSSSPTATARPHRPPALRQNASIPASQLSTKISNTTERHIRARSAVGASSSKGKSKGTLDAFMDSRQGTTVNEPESSGSDSDLPLYKVLALPPSDDYSVSDSSALPSSSPPSSSPLRTPKGSSPFHPPHHYASSPMPKHLPRPASSLPFLLPPGPYSFEKPPWSLSALIGQALNASRSGSLTLSDIYSYVSTVYPHYDRSEQSWMSSIRHNLSIQDAFERAPDEESQMKKDKRKPKARGGLWRITPGYEACFVGGNFFKKNANGAGPALTHSRKRPREDDWERSDKKSKAESRPRSATPLASTFTRLQMRPSPNSPTRTIYSGRPSPSPPSLTMSQSTVSSEVLRDPTDLPTSPPTPTGHDIDSMAGDYPDSPELPLALAAAQRNVTKGGSMSFASLLDSGFEPTRISDFQSSPRLPALETPDGDVSRDLFTRVLASTTSAHASSLSKPSSSASPGRLLFPSALTSSSDSLATTPPPRQDCVRATLSPTRTPMSHRGVHMSPSRSLAHYKTSLEPEWKIAAILSEPEGCHTPPPPDHCEIGDETSTPRKAMFLPRVPTSPFRTPARCAGRGRDQRGYDPYDPNMLLADELASIRDAREPQESPGGFFGKEGRKLLYESPGVPSRSHWRFRDDL